MSQQFPERSRGSSALPVDVLHLPRSLMRGFTSPSVTLWLAVAAACLTTSFGFLPADAGFGNFGTRNRPRLGPDRKAPPQSLGSRTRHHLSQQTHCTQNRRPGLRSVAASGAEGLTVSQPPISPQDLPESTIYFFDEPTSTHVYIVGTFHLSRVSAEEVRDIIHKAKPATVMIELCPSRYVNMLLESKERDLNPSLTGANQTTPALPLGNLASSRAADAVARFLSGTYSMLRGFGVESGSEFSAAAEEAQALGSRLVLGDRDAFSTLDEMTSTGDVKTLLNPEHFAKNISIFIDAFRPAKEGKLSVLKLFAASERLLGVLPLAATISALLAASAWIAWRAETAAGVAEEAHRAVDDVVFSIPLSLMLLLLPRLSHVVIGARDAHLLSSLLECCDLAPRSRELGPLQRKQPDSARTSPATARADGDGDTRADVVVGVVGLLHVNGMLRRYAAGARPLATPHAVWMSQDGQRFVPPPGFEWKDTDSSSFAVVRAGEDAEAGSVAAPVAAGPAQALAQPHPHPPQQPQ